MEINVSTICMIGAAAVGVGAITALILSYRKNHNLDNSKLSDIFSASTDEQLVVDTLNGEELTKWFKKKNLDNCLTNIIIFPNEKNLQQFKIPKGIVADTGNIILQALYNEEKDKTILCRTVIFETINPKLKQMLDENDGMIIVE